MRAPLRYIPLLLLAGLFWACGGDRALQVSLDRADALMEAHPDSALALLKPYDGMQIRSEAQRARFSLLYSMALDKNYIDIDSLTVLQPALDYYPTHGTDADKIRTLYYAGRIYENAGHMEKAMEVWAEGLQYRGSKTDSLTLARLLVAQGNEYYRLYQFDKFVENQRQAEYIYRSLGRKDLADKAFLNQFELSLNRDSVYAKANIRKVAQLALDSTSFNGELARSKVLQYEMHFGTSESLVARLKEYERYSKDSLDLTQALLNLGRISEAERILLATQPDSNFHIKYLLRKQRLEKAKGNFEEALKSSELILKTFDQEQSAVIEGGTQFAEERFQWRTTVEKHKQSELYIVIIGAASVIVVLLITIMLYYKWISSRNKKAFLEEQTRRLEIEKQNRELEIEHMNHQLLGMEEEKAALEKIVNEDSIIRKAVSKRLAILNSLIPIIEGGGNNQKKLAEALRALTADRKEFLRNTRLSMSATHPALIEYFKEKELSDDEIVFAYLLSSGFSGKEAGYIVGKKAHYNYSADIRKKLGLQQGDRYLSHHIRQLIDELDS